jgi:chromosomal replication initiator protein
MISPPEIWDGVLRRLGVELPAHTLAAWVAPLSVESASGGLRLLCPSRFHRDRIQDRMLPLIEQCAAAEAGEPVTLELVVAPPRSSSDAGPVQPEPAAPAAGPDRQPRPRPAQRAFPYTFESFVVGPCNALAREASLAVARGRQQAANPLYLVSAPGHGKTHLARAICAEAKSTGRARALYAPAEGFTNEFMDSIRSKEMSRFKRRYRNECELLVVEDVQFLGSKKATQLELFHTVAHLLDAGVRVVFTADRLPARVDELDPRLSSQMTAGLVAEIEAPDANVRRQILRSKASSGGLRLPDKCLDRLVDGARGSVRDLEGVLIQLAASASLLSRPIDLELTEAALRKLAPVRPETARLDVRTVIDVVARFFQTKPENLASRSRRRDVLLPRQLAMYLCHRYTDASHATIGRAFDRDHPSVRNAVKVVERRMLERAPLRYRVEALCARLDELERKKRN